MIDFKHLLKVEMAFTGKPFYSIENIAESRRLVIPDIHGCFNTFMALLNQVDLKREDNLFLLGDYINRGKKSKEVVDKIVELIEKGYNIFPLRGNHEQALLNIHLKDYTPEELMLPSRFRNKAILNEKYKIRDEYLGLISNLPYYYELPDCYLVHAGFDFNSIDFLLDYKSMVWKSDFENSSNALSKRIVVGHKAKSLNEIMGEIKNHSNVIHLDNGCVYKSNPNLGNLLCYDLDTNKLWVQRNVEE